MEKIDKFFKDKLQEHSITPPENAWNKVEGNLSKKNNAFVWRIAAAILLMGALIGVFIWSKQNSESTNQSSNNLENKPNKNISSTSVEKPKEIKKAPDKKILVAPVERKQIQSVKDEPVNKIKLVKTETALTQQITEKFSTDNSIEEKQKEQATVMSEVASTKRKPIKLEFTLEDISSEETVATTYEVKKSGIKKVLNMARDMKQGEGLVTNIREKKDELFAHNFITGKKAQ